MRFRRLTLDELKELHEEFIQFLSSNTITGDDWKKLKEENYSKAESLIDIFSDIVLEKSISNIKFLEKRDAKTLLLFYCKEKDIELIGLSIDSNTSVDFTNPEDIDALAKGKLNIKINTFKTSKPYNKNREDEIFTLLNDGCLVTDKKLFNVLLTTL